MAENSAIALKVDAPLAPTGEGAALISMIERAARDPAVDIEKFERLMTMKERVMAKEAMRAFNAAVSTAKSEIGPIVKNKTVDFTSQKGRTHYKHEDFAEVARTVDPVLGKVGLSYRFRSSQEGQRVSVTCILFHADGHSEETMLSTSEDHTGNKNAIQAIGSTTTYLQRYTLKLALGLASSEDDDGKASKAQAETISEDEEMALREYAESVGTNIPAFCQYFKVAKLADLPKSELARANAALKKKASK